MTTKWRVEVSPPPLFRGDAHFEVLFVEAADAESAERQVWDAINSRWNSPRIRSVTEVAVTTEHQLVNA